MATAPNEDTRTEISPASSEKDLDQLLEFPLSILDWASEIDPTNQGVYQGIRQGAITDAMSELIYQSSGVSIDSTSSEYELLKSAVARATFATPRGHTLKQLNGERN